MTKQVSVPAEFVRPLKIDGLNSRVLKVPASGAKKRRILLIAGQHTSLERLFGMATYLSRYGAVTSPDLPGFGGMDPLYKVGKKPTLDNMADYLAEFINKQYEADRFSIMAVSYGFSVVTRMLQRHPKLAEQVDLLISISGIVDKRDFKWKRRNIVVTHSGAWVLSHRLPSTFVTNFILSGPLIRILYRIAENKHPKLKDADPAERKERINFEIKLWKLNDFRTWMATCVTMFQLDLSSTKIDLPVYHVTVDNDHYFNNDLVERHMRQIYKDFFLVRTTLPAHVPTILATPKEVEPFVPPKIRELLNKDTA